MISKLDFVVSIRHLCWCCYQMGAGQDYNTIPTDDQLESLADAVRAVVNNPDMTPEENHENWMRMKTEQGWAWGPIKSATSKRHPDLIPYDELPEVERKKDDMDLLAHRVAMELYDELMEGDG